MAIDIVDLPVKKGDFPISYVSLPEGIVHIHTTSTSFIDGGHLGFQWIGLGKS
jgi:hypothetical protein